MYDVFFHSTEHASSLICAASMLIDVAFHTKYGDPADARAKYDFTLGSVFSELHVART